MCWINLQKTKLGYCFVFLCVGYEGFNNFPYSQWLGALVFDREFKAYSIYLLSNFLIIRFILKSNDKDWIYEVWNENIPQVISSYRRRLSQAGVVIWKNSYFEWSFHDPNVRKNLASATLLYQNDYTLIMDLIK